MEGSEDEWVENMKILIDDVFLDSKTKSEFMEKMTKILQECRMYRNDFDEIEAYALKKVDTWELEKLRGETS